MKLTPTELRDLKRLAVQMIGAASAYEQYAKGDPMKLSRVADFKRAAAIGQKLVAGCSRGSDGK